MGMEYRMFGYLDLDGNPVERTPDKNMYSYDAFVVYKSSEYSSTDFAVYSDRMIRWNRENFERAVKTVWPEHTGSQMFYGRTHSDIEKFLSVYYDKTVKLTAIMEGCNFSGGYPYWVFYYKEQTTHEGGNNS